MTIPIIINGALGKMGVEIANLVLADTSVSLAGCFDRAGHSSQGKDYGLSIGRGEIGVAVSDAVDQAAAKGAVIIDFSSPVSTRVLLEKADAEGGCPMVIGTTGLADADYAIAKQVALKTPVLVSPNMSLAVNLLFALTEIAASRLKNDFDIEIIETHHRFKKDAPSGTAKRLGEIIAAEFEKDYETLVRNGRSGISAKDRGREEIGMHAVRGGDIVGDHTVLFAGIGERVELRHMAHSRSTFARGAVAAAKWLYNQKPGYYSMKDVLGL